MSLTNYQKAQKVTETPREMEYRLMAQITAQLTAARDQNLKGSDLISTLHRNREMWTTFASDCAVEGNGLPDALRANIISVSLWVGRHTTLVATGRETVDELINVNRNVMAGLAPAQRQAA